MVSLTLYSVSISFQKVLSWRRSLFQMIRGYQANTIDDHRLGVTCKNEKNNYIWESLHFKKRWIYASTMKEIFSNNHEQWLEEACKQISNFENPGLKLVTTDNMKLQPF